MTFLLLRIIYCSHMATNVRPISVWDKLAALHSSLVTRGNAAYEFGWRADTRSRLCNMHRLWDIPHLICGQFGGHMMHKLSSWNCQSNLDSQWVARGLRGCRGACLAAPAVSCLRAAGCCHSLRGFFGDCVW